MSKLNIIFIFLLVCLCVNFATAQDEPPENADGQFEQQNRPNLLRELGLTQDQVRQIRQIRQDSRENMRAAQQRVNLARRSLDEAIYADNSDDATVQTKLREFQDAQAEIAKLRALNEFSIRKILTPEQLVRFREMRQRFERMRRERQPNRRDGFQNPPPRRPVQNFKNSRQKQPPKNNF